MAVSSSTSNEVSFLAYDPDVRPYLSLIEFESALKLTNEGIWSARFSSSFIRTKIICFFLCMSNHLSFLFLNSIQFDLLPS